MIKERVHFGSFQGNDYLVLGEWFLLGHIWQQYQRQTHQNILKMSTRVMFLPSRDTLSLSR